MAKPIIAIFLIVAAIFICCFADFRNLFFPGITFGILVIAVGLLIWYKTGNARKIFKKGERDGKH